MGLTRIYTGSCRWRTFIPSYDEQIRKHPASPSLRSQLEGSRRLQQTRKSLLPLSPQQCKCNVEPLTGNKAEILWRFDLFWFMHNFLFHIMHFNCILILYPKLQHKKIIHYYMYLIIHNTYSVCFFSINHLQIFQKPLFKYFIFLPSIHSQVFSHTYFYFFTFSH